MTGSTRKTPWGKATIYNLNRPISVRMLCIDGGEKTSLQTHTKRDICLISLDDDIKIQIDDTEIVSKKQGEYWIQRQSLYRLSNTGKILRCIIELSFGEYDKGDVKRYEDKYGRKVKRLKGRLKKLLKK